MIEEVDLAVSKKVVGEIYPVIKDQHGNILDGKHRKAVNPDWKETVVEVKDELEALLIRVHANVVRREIPIEEKQEWVREARRILQKKGLKGTQKEIAEALGISRTWVVKYDVEPVYPNRAPHVSQRDTSANHKINNIQDEGFGKEIWSPKAPIDIDTKKTVTCPECGRNFRLIHIWKGNLIMHKIERVKE